MIVSQLTDKAKSHSQNLNYSKPLVTMAATAFNNTIVVEQILDFLDDDRATIHAAMLLNQTTAALARSHV